jgi:hypothetical protein
MLEKKLLKAHLKTFEVSIVGEDGHDAHGCLERNTSRVVLRDHQCMSQCELW